MKGQILFRQLRWDAPYPSMTTGNAHAGVGVIDMPEGYLPEETILGLIWHDDSLLFTGEKIPIEANYNYHDLATHVTNLDFPAPPEDTGLAGGGLILRRTRKPSATPGHIVCLALLVVRNVPREFDRKTIYDIAEKTRGIPVLTAGQVIGFEPNGMALSQIHKSPIWGWDEEPWGPVSTLNLSAIDDIHAYMEREEAGTPQPDDLHAEIKWLMKPKADSDYDEFKRRMRTAGHVQRWDAILTRSQTEAHERAASQIVRDILAERDAA